MTLGGTWTNENGILNVTDSTVNLGSNFTLASLGTLTSSGGTINVTGTLDNTGTNLALDASTGGWLLHGGTIIGGTVATSGGAPIQVTSSDGTLDGVTLNTDITLQQGAIVTVLNGLTLNGTATLTRTTNSAGISSFTGINFLNGSQTLGGTGEVHFAGTASPSPSVSWVRPTGTGELTIGPNITIRTSPLAGTVGHPSRPLIIQGTLSAETAGKTLVVTGSTITNDGSIAITAGSLVSVTGPFTQSSSGSLAFELGGTLANEFGKLTSSSAFTLDGTLDISVSGGFTLTSGNDFEIMTFGSVSGDFSTKNGLDQGGLTLQLNYGAMNLRLLAP